MVEVGEKYGRLTVVGITTSKKEYKDRTRTLKYAVCVCDCGKKKAVRVESLTCGLIQSCGCLKSEKTIERNKESATHNMSRSRLYRIWRCMKDRCYNNSHSAYMNYGGRGITICDEWKNDFREFMVWAFGSGYAEDLTIDRIDVNGNYEPDNCRWATMKEQEQNRRNSIYIDFPMEDGEVITMPIAEAAGRVGLTRKQLYKRIMAGWPISDALFLPITQANAHYQRPQIRVEVIRKTSWNDVKEAALETMNLKMKTPPDREWKMNMLMARHSPIQSLEFAIKLYNIPYNISVHFVRHHLGITHFVGTQRTDRCGGIDRDQLPQNAPVNHEMFLNAQSIIAISKKRLCAKASLETRQIWSQVVEGIRKIEPELAAFCQPECWWCGNQCPESVPCGKCIKKPMPQVLEYVDGKYVAV